MLGKGGGKGSWAGREERGYVVPPNPFLRTFRIIFFRYKLKNAVISPESLVNLLLSNFLCFHLANALSASHFPNPPFARLRARVLFVFRTPQNRLR